VQPFVRLSIHNSGRVADPPASEIGEQTAGSRRHFPVKHCTIDGRRPGILSRMRAIILSYAWVGFSVIVQYVLHIGAVGAIWR
jgi:hypothetical protein